MYCKNCGEQLSPEVKFCQKCGAQVEQMNAQTVTPAPFQQMKFPAHDRGPMIVALGILAIIIFGPFTGVPGWVMANQDINDIRKGFIPATSYGTVRTGKTLNIIGTFVSLVSLIVIGVIGMCLFVFTMVAVEMVSTVF